MKKNIILLLMACFLVTGCGQSERQDAPIKPTITSSTEAPTVPALKEKIRMTQNHLICHDFSDGMGNFQGAQWQQTPHGVQNVSTGWGTQLEYIMRTNLDDRKMSVQFTAESSDTVIVIGNKNLDNMNTSTFYGVDFAKSELQIYQNWNNDINMPVAPIVKKTDMELVTGREYTLEYEAHSLFDCTVTLRDTVTGEEDSFERNDAPFCGWDSPCIIVVSGIAEIQLVEYCYTTPSNTKLAVYGDSFIEGSSLGHENIDKRYVQLIENALGEEILIDGRGGEDSFGVYWKYGTDSKCQAEYTLIAIGTNESDYPRWLENIQTIIALVEEDGSKPILATVTRRQDRDNLAFILQTNEWIRTSGYPYLDVAAAVSVDGDGQTIDQDLYYSDMVHPNPAGHQKIFERSLIDLPFLYGET